MEMSDASMLLMPFLGVIAVIALAYYGTRWLAKRYSGMLSGKYMRIIERVPAGQDKSLILVSAGGKIHMIGVSAKGIYPLYTYEKDQLESIPPEGREPSQFAGLFDGLLKKVGHKNGTDGEGEEKL